MTPEEGVRQWFIGVLNTQCGFPFHLMNSEVAFEFGPEVGWLKGSSRKRYRADIVIYDRSHKPFATVECKRPEVPLDQKVAEQAMRYNAVLGVEWIILTNGTKTLAFHREGDVFVPSATLPMFA